jgi:hypothetical protein
MAAISASGSLPNFLGLSDNDIESLEEREQPSEEDEEIILSWVADLPQQLQQMHEQLQGRILLPPVVPTAEDNDQPINFEECHTMLDKFFSARVFGKNQTMT